MWAALVWGACTPDVPSTTETTTTGGTGQPALETIRVVTWGDEAPLGGVEVLVSAADGAVAGLFTTDPAGEVHTDVPEGGSVSLAEDGPYGAAWVRTTFDVPQGGLTVIGSQRLLAGTAEPTGFEYSMTVTASGSPPGTAAWEARTRCDSWGANSPGPWVLSNDRCVGYADDHVFVLARDAGGALLAWGAALNLPFDGDNIVVTVPVNETAVATVDVDVIGAPVGTTDLSANVVLLMDGDWQIYGVGALGGTSLSASITVPVAPVDRYRVVVGGTLPGETFIGELTFTDGVPASRVFDAGRLPQITLEPLDLSDPAHPSIAWTRSAWGKEDLGTATVAFTNEGPDLRYWHVRFDPGARTQVCFPDLPEEWAEAVPDPETVFTTNLALWDYDFLDGYTEGVAWSETLPEFYSYTYASAFD